MSRASSSRRRRATRLLGVAALCGLAALAVFLVPTLWGKPWSIEQLYLRVFAEFALERPELLSRLRILEPWGLDWFSDDLDDYSLAFEQRTARREAEELAILRSYDRAAQSESQRLSTDVLDSFLALQAEGERFLLHDYPVNPMSGVQNDLPDFMLNVHQIHSRADAEHYVARLAKFGVAFDQVIDGLRQREAHGFLPPRFVIERVLADLARFLAASPAEHVLATDFDTPQPRGRGPLRCDARAARCARAGRARAHGLSGLPPPREPARRHARARGQRRRRVAPARRRGLLRLDGASAHDDRPHATRDPRARARRGEAHPAGDARDPALARARCGRSLRRNPRARPRSAFLVSRHR